MQTSFLAHSSLEKIHMQLQHRHFVGVRRIAPNILVGRGRKLASWRVDSLEKIQVQLRRQFVGVRRKAPNILVGRGPKLASWCVGSLEKILVRFSIAAAIALVRFPRENGHPLSMELAQPFRSHGFRTPQA